MICELKEGKLGCIRPLCERLRYNLVIDSVIDGNTHPQTPLTQQQRARFRGLDYYAYDPAWRLMGTVDRDVEREAFVVELPAEGTLRYTRVARILFSVGGSRPR